MKYPPHHMRLAILLLVTTLIEKTALGEEPASFQGLGHLLPEGSLSVAWDVSADGSVVIGLSRAGQAETQEELSGKLQAFRWTPAGGMVGLGYLAGGASLISEAMGVSADGSVIAGISTSAAAVFSEAFRWTRDEGMKGLGFLPGGPRQSWATGVSPDGAAVVGFAFSEERIEAFRWTRAGGMLGLGDLPGGGFFSRAADASLRGEIVGVSRSGDSAGEAFLWTPEAGMTALGFLSYDGLSLERYGSEAHAVSADGSVIVGHSNSVAGADEAFRWTRAEGMVGLGDLPGGEYKSDAWGVSADGSVVVGVGTTEAGEEAFIWDSVHGMRLLKDVLQRDFGLELTGWQLRAARRVSDDGRVVVGEGEHQDRGTEPWRAVLGPLLSSSST